MKLKLTPHFQARMYERGIRIDDVRKAINAPDFKEDAFEDRIKVAKTLNGKTIEVIYYKDSFRDRSSEYIVVTAYYL